MSKELTNQTIPCPNSGCGGLITFNTSELFQGKEISCLKCNSVISLSDESNELVEDAFEKFEAMREKYIENKSNG